MMMSSAESLLGRCTTPRRLAAALAALALLMMSPV
jgi:hypothetical protein